MAKQSKKKKAPDGESPREVAGKNAITPSSSSWCKRDWLWGLLLVLAVILVYQPVWYAGFIWDDAGVVTANPVIVGPLGLKEIWTTSAADICPLTLTTFWVEHALWGLSSSLLYHLVNVVMHAACAILLWRVLRSLQVPGAWLGAALWALHPMQVESVAWISELKNTESGLFFLLSILFFVRWLKAKNSDGQTGNGWSYAFTLLFAVLAMASKSSAVILPLVLCLCAWWMEGRWQWRNVARVGPIFLMSFAVGVVSVWTQKLNGATHPLGIRTWPERLVTAGDAVWFYLGKLIWPHPLVAIYPRWEIDVGRWFSYLPLLAVIIVSLVLWRKRRAWARPYFFAWAYFLAALLPVLGLVNMNFLLNSFVADHFQYLAGMGPLALAGAGMVRLADFAIPGKAWRQASLCAGLLLILGMASWQRAWAYESEETFWTDTLSKNPNSWKGHNNLGVALYRKGRLDEAMTHFQKALEINPNYAEARAELGNILVQKGYLDEGMAQFQKALEINPDLAQAHNGFGVALFRRGKVDEAITQYQRALEINPNYADAYSNLGFALLQRGRMDEAIVQLQRAVAINPNFATARNNLGRALFGRGEADEAVAQFQRALEIDPNYAEAHNNLGVIFFRKGRLKEAVAQFQKAVGIAPNYGDAYNGLGAALAQEGHLDEAVVQFQRAVQLDPNDGNAQKNLAAVQAAARQRASHP